MQSPVLRPLLLLFLAIGAVTVVTVRFMDRDIGNARALPSSEGAIAPYTAEQDMHRLDIDTGIFGQDGAVSSQSVTTQSSVPSSSASSLSADRQFLLRMRQASVSPRRSAPIAPSSAASSVFPPSEWLFSSDSLPSRPERMQAGHDRPGSNR